jgi:endonuclease/exonuclease/phosphatase family metal-dependent hydrolase
MKFLLLIIPLLLQALTFKVASYNVENLFDMHYSGHEYVEYIPNSKFGWNKITYQKKLQNISKVIYDLHADIIGLEEIESKQALLDLRKFIKKRGLVYRYFAIADKKDSTVKVAILSRYQITKTREIKVSYLNKYRDILEIHLLIAGKKLIIFVNHWKSKSGPESERIKYAKALKKRLSVIPKNKDYIVLGDFNSNYNEYITIRHNKKLNNTRGKTGINDILQTKIDGKMTTKNDVKTNCNLLYNLWMDLPLGQRYSYIYHGEKDTIDNILIPCSMLNKSSISYIQNSFNVFKPPYLFKNGLVKRWERRYGYGKFTGIGYSDHLPIYAFFTTDKKYKNFPIKKAIKPYELATINSLYVIRVLKKPLIIKQAVVIQKDKIGCTVKILGGRAIYIYHFNRLFKKGYMYNIVVNSVKNYHENLEINSIKDVTEIKRVKHLKKYYIHYKDNLDLSKKEYLNEIIYKLKGIYKKSYLFYSKNRKIRIYNKIKNFYIKNGRYLKLKFVRIISYKNEPEIILHYKRNVI